MEFRKANINNALTNLLTCRTIENYEGLYMVTYNGMVYSLITNKFLKAGISHATGYLSVSISKNKVHKTYYVHRLVGLAFIEPIDGKTKINHKSGIKLNNHFSNLEWVTSKENNTHATEMGLRKNKCTTQMIAEVLRLHIKADKEYGAKSLAKMFNVEKGAIHNILNKHKYNA